MKKIIILIALLIVTCISFSVNAEGLLPGLSDVYGVAMPSLCDILNRYPDQVNDLEDGGVEISFDNVTEEQYAKFGEALGNDGCEIIESSVEGDVFHAVVGKDGKSFSFSYDTVKESVVITYTDGSYDPVIKEAEEQYQEAVTLIEGQHFEDALAILNKITGYKDVDTKITEANEGDTEASYQQALALLNKGQYEEAYDIFTTIIDYKDSQYILDFTDELYMIGLHSRWPIGETIEFGVFDLERENLYGMEKGEKLYWEILEYEENKALICTRWCVDRKNYNDSDSAATNWSKCSLRKWLNGTFYKSCFTSDEQKLIYETKLENPDGDPVFNKPGISGGPNTTDRVFIPDKSIGRGGWIRKPGDRPYCAVCGGNSVNARFPGEVYPMMWIDLVKFDERTYTKVDPEQYKNQEGNAEGIEVNNADDRSTPDTEVLKKGSKGDAVKRLQQALIDQGFLTGSADGQFGKMTEAAVKEAQASFGLPQTGIADSSLLEKLYN